MIPQQLAKLNLDMGKISASDPNTDKPKASARLSARFSHAERSARGILTDLKAEAYIANKGAHQKLTWRDRVYLGLNSPSSSQLALFTALLLSLLTLAATLSYALSTKRELGRRSARSPRGS